MDEIKISKFLSLILRHKPQAVGIELDSHGWANVRELLQKMSRTHPIDMALLEKIVAEDEKQRYSFNEDKTLIRANQGHSIYVDIEFERKEPPEVLYHGSAEKYAESIEHHGIQPRSRMYVHLSTERKTAANVGRRHGSPIVYRIDSKRMHDDGFEFYLSANCIWLTNFVPVEYITRCGDNAEIS